MRLSTRCAAIIRGVDETSPVLDLSGRAESRDTRLLRLQSWGRNHGLRAVRLGLLCVAITSVVGCSYTSISFLGNMGDRTLAWMIVDLGSDAPARRPGLASDSASDRGRADQRRPVARDLTRRLSTVFADELICSYRSLFSQGGRARSCLAVAVLFLPVEFRRGPPLSRLRLVL